MLIRISLFDDEIDGLQLFDPITGHLRHKLTRFTVFPSSHYVTPRNTVLRAIEAIKEELRDRVEYFTRENRLVEAQRIEQRTRFDLEMLDQLGFLQRYRELLAPSVGKKDGRTAADIDRLPADGCANVHR